MAERRCCNARDPLNLIRLIPAEGGSAVSAVSIPNEEMT